uniref:Uncharacterized protein LOC111112649 isoform X1 n=1 Tax=Crassostrea virginica TaxID=6565 RepID=A0A8B8BT38_CRAVI|nr:uncharacterized protein LOC111112649 isoform X1 [Crassostrea virginica]
MKRRMTDNIFADPRPVKYRNNPGFCDRVRNMVFNYCSRSSENLAFRYLYSQANIQLSTKDHDYLALPFTEYWIDSALQDSLIEVKCPYNGRNEKIVAGKCFKFLTVDDDNNIVLRQNSDYYFQIQGQLYIS